MNDYLEHKGYLGAVRYSLADNVLYGEVVGIRGSILYHGSNLDDLKRDFESAVEHYLSCCEGEDIAPQPPCHGALNVQISPAIHKQLQIYASNNNKTQGQTIEDALRNYLTA